MIISSYIFIEKIRIIEKIRKLIIWILELKTGHDIPCELSSIGGF